MGAVPFAFSPAKGMVRSSLFAYDGDNLIEEANSSGTEVASYSQGLNIDEPLAMDRSSVASFYEADGLGSVTSLSSTAGVLAQTYTFDSFGKQTAATGSLTNPFQYTARESDAETGLYYYRARYYDPASGRFALGDPIRWAGGLNLYRYVKNQPEILSDPSGLFGWSEANDETKCLVCTVFAEGRGMSSSCQYAIASVIINRLAEKRAKGNKPVTICDIVSAHGQFLGYGNRNYNNCINNVCPANDRQELDDTWRYFGSPFNMLSNALYFGDNTPEVIQIFNKYKKKPISFPACPDLVFYGDP